MSILGVLELLERLKGHFLDFLSLFVMRGFGEAGDFDVFCERPQRLVLVN